MKNLGCGCSFQEVNCRNSLNTNNTYSANHLIARGSKLCQEVSEMDAFISSHSNVHSEATEKQISDELSTTSRGKIPNNEVPKVFVESNSYEEDLPPHNDTVKCTSFMQKVINNAKTMLTTRCSALHPSTCSDEPTRETDDCQYDSNATTASSSKIAEFPILPKYSPSDYCLCDEEGQDSSSKLDSTTTAETLPKEISSKETSSSSKQTTPVDYSKLSQCSKTERSRITLGSLYSTAANLPCSCTNDTEEPGPYDGPNGPYEDPVSQSDANFKGHHDPFYCHSGSSHRGPAYSSIAHFEGQSGYLESDNGHFEGHKGTFEGCNESYGRYEGPRHRSADGCKHHIAGINRTNTAPECLDVGLEKTETSRKMFSLLDTTWFNPFRRDTPKKCNITNPKSDFKNIDGNNLGTYIPCRDVTCYRVDGGVMRANSADPTFKKTHFHKSAKENCYAAEHMSRGTISPNANSLHETKKIKARSCDPHCPVCNKNKNNCKNNKDLVSTGFNSRDPSVDRCTKMSFYGCDPNCPVCWQGNSDNNGDQRIQEPDRVVVSNASVGSTKIRTICLDVIDKGIGVDETCLSPLPKEENPPRFVERSPSNTSNQKSVELSDEANTTKNDTGSQQETPCNSLSCQLSFTSMKSYKLSCPTVNVNSINKNKENNEDYKKTEKRKNFSRNDSSPSPKRVRSNHQKDEDNQCAFVGSPVLNSANFRGSVISANWSCNVQDGSFCPKYRLKDLSRDRDSDRISDRYRYRDDDIDRARDRHRDADRDSYESRISSHSNDPELRYPERRFSRFPGHGSYAGSSRMVRGIDDELGRVTRELKTENRVLKSELLEMKLELKHALEKVEGPMRSKLEAEKCRCEQLQHELQRASYDMKVSHDTFAKESQDLKAQLTMACSNMNLLETINKRLKDEMGALDGLCAKLEEDLVNQKLSEAETLKRLTIRRNCGGDMKSTTDIFNESNLNILARKLSKTLKETEPCEECLNVPSELTGAAKMIKDLTDMVERRKANRISLDAFDSKINCSCQSPPPVEEIACQCLAISDIGVEVSKSLNSYLLPCLSQDASKATRTIFPISQRFITEDSSSRNIMEEIRLRAHSPSALCQITFPGDPPFLKNQCTDPKTADKKINYDPPKFALVERVMVDQEINYDACEPCKGDGNQCVKEPNSQVVACYMVKTPVCPISTKPQTQDKASPPTMRDQYTVFSNSQTCGDIEHPPCEDLGVPCVKNVQSSYLSCEQLDVSPPKDQNQRVKNQSKEPTIKDESTCDALGTPPCQVEDIPCARKKSVKFSPCEKMESPPCEIINKPCVENQDCDITSDAPIQEDVKPATVQLDAPCMHIGVPCAKKRYDVDDSSYKETVSNKTCKSLETPPCKEESAPCVEKKQNKPLTCNVVERIEEPIKPADKDMKDGVKERQPSPCAHLGEPCVNKKSKTDSEKQVSVRDASIGDKITTSDKSIGDTVSRSDKESVTTCPVSTEIPIDGNVELCSEDGPCVAVGRPCAELSQHEEIAGLHSDDAPCESIATSCNTSSQTVETTEKKTETDKTETQDSAEIGKPAVKKKKSQDLLETFSSETETHEHALEEPPSDLHVITTVIKEGNLEVVTEGPLGVIETTLNYLPDGALEVQTQINESERSKGSRRLSSLQRAMSPSSKKEFSLKRQELLAKQKSSLMSGESGLTNLDSEMTFPKTEPSSTTIKDSFLDEIIICPQTKKPCKDSALSSKPSHTSGNKMLGKQLLKIQAAGTQGSYARETGTATEPQQMTEKETISDVDTKNIGACVCIKQMEKTTSHGLPTADAIVGAAEITSKDTPVSLEDLSVSSPQQTSQVEVSVKSVGEDDTKATVASSTLPIEMVPKAEYTSELRSDQGITTNGIDGVSEQETYTDTSLKENMGTSPEKPIKKEASIVAKPSKADKQESQHAELCQNRDCGCQSTPSPTEQSCQCCECKEIGVSTAEYSETLGIPGTMVQNKFSVKSTKDKSPKDTYPVEPDFKTAETEEYHSAYDRTTIEPDGHILQTQLAGSILQPDGNIIRGDGSIIRPDGSKIQPNGTVVSPVGARVSDANTSLSLIKGSVIRPDQTYVQSDGSIVAANKSQPVGSVVQSDGNIIRPDGIVVLPDGTTLQLNETYIGPDGKIHPMEITVRSDEGNEQLGKKTVQPNGKILGRDLSFQQVGSKILENISNIRPHGSITHPTEGIVESDGSVLPVLSVRSDEDNVYPASPLDETILPQDGSFQPLEPLVSKDRSILKPDGSVVRPDAATSDQDKIIQPQEAIIRNVGSVLKPDGSVVRPNESFGTPNGNIRSDGSVVRPNETVFYGNLQQVGSNRVQEGSNVGRGESNIKTNGSKVSGKGIVVRRDGTVVEPNGSVQPLGVIVHENRSVLKSDDNTIRPDETIIAPDGSSRNVGSTVQDGGNILRPDGITVYSDEKVIGTEVIVHTSGSIIRPDASAVHPVRSITPMDEFEVKDSEQLIKLVEREETEVLSSGIVVRPGSYIRKNETIRPDAPIELYDSSDVKSRIRDKKSSKEMDKIEKTDSRRSSEVPDFVSKLSSKSMPPLLEISDNTRPRKKRSSKLESKPCTCTGICNCIVCSSDIMEKRLLTRGTTEPQGPNAKLCCCGGIPKQSQGEAESTQAYNFTGKNEPHPPHCKCKSCRCDPCAIPCRRECEAFLRMTNYENLSRNRQKSRASVDDENSYRRQKSRISIDDVFNPKTYNKDQEQLVARQVFRCKHNIDCECIDCLCSPMIKDLCSTREFPHVREEKQIYQVSNIKCECPNTKKVSKIPISTNPAVPKVKSLGVSCSCDPCECSPCTDVNKRGETSGAQGAEDCEKDDKLPTAEEIMKMTPEQLKSLCDCDPCNCDVCYNKPGGADGINPPCCCKPGCTCELCQVEEMKQQIEKLRQEIDSLKSTKTRPPGQPDDCDCEVCVCPTNKDGEHGEDCDCDVCQCPAGPNAGGAASAPGTGGGAADSADQDEECDCNVCQCPLSPLKQKVPGHPEDCECDICACPLAPAAGDTTACNCGDYCNCPGGPNAGKKKEMTGCTCKPPCLCPGGPIPTCDCQPECDCSPCADPRKKPKGVPTCDCVPCACSPCADPRKASDKDEHEINCTCPECKCSDAEKPKEEPNPETCICEVCTCEEEQAAPTNQCDCPICVCEEAVADAPHLDGCTCDICKCTPEDDTVEAKKQVDVDCVCEGPCKCDQEEETAYSVPGKLICTCGDACVCDQGDTAIQTDLATSTLKSQGTHPINCVCEDCQCADQVGGDQVGGDQVGRDQVGGDQVGGDQVGGDQVGGDQVGGEQVGGDQVDGGGVGGAEGDKCVCSDCQCPDCYYKTNTEVPHSIDCKCATCICVDCFNTSGKGGTAADRGVVAGGGAATNGGADCKCPDCKCNPCIHKSPTDQKFKCKCGVCTCVDCEGEDSGGNKRAGDSKHEKKEEKAVAEPLPKDRSCHCIDCYCDECTNEKKKGSKARPETVIQIAPKKDTPKMATTGTVPAEPIECTCLHCICVECVTKQLSGRSAEGAQHNIACKCALCQCGGCGGPELKTQASCMFSTCTCADCVTKPACQDSRPQQKDAECHCVTCECEECMMKARNKDKEHESNCKCPICTCSPCQETIPEKKDAECHCATCKCEDCTSEGNAKKGTDQKGTDQEVTVQKGTDQKETDQKGTDQEVTVQKGTDQEVTVQKGTDQEMTVQRVTDQSEAPPFELPQKIDCDCKPCNCIICVSQGAGGSRPAGAAGPAGGLGPAKSSLPTGGSGPSEGAVPPFELPQRIQCACQNCTCPLCEKGGQATQGRSSPATQNVGTVPQGTNHQTSCQCICKTDNSNRPRGGGAFEPLKSFPCYCNSCQCPVCTKDGKLTASPGGDIFNIPIRLPCHCDNCTCIICKASTPHSTTGQSVPVIAIASSNFASSRPRTAPGGISSDSCDCTMCACPSECLSTNKSAPSSICRCPECTVEKPSQVSAIVGDSIGHTNTRIKTTINQESSFVGTKSPKQYPACLCVSCPDTSLKIEESSQFAPPSRGSAKEISCVCLDCCVCEKSDGVDLSLMDNATLVKQIETNTKENCSCKEQIKEIKTALHRIKSACSDAEKKVKTPMVKQASTFRQTMSGLKLALINLQEKCKAKDKMIEVMTGELRNRTSSQTLLDVLNGCTGDVPDYDRAEDVLHKHKTNDHQTFDEKMARAEETERGNRKKKPKPCKCGKIHKNRDNKNVNLSGFEVVDIRRITYDSIIIKWKPPKSNVITGYDIFINGVNKSKVMSGGRTSAMVHSIDLSETIQITIYAVTKCGRCEPPAIAIYEIRSQK